MFFLQENFDVLSMFVANISLVHIILLLFAPAFSAGLLSREAEQLKLVLQFRLLQERGQKINICIYFIIRSITPCGL
jgi:hypothetical protein